MDELKNKAVFIVMKANFLGLPSYGLTIIPATVHQQHGKDVHCFIKVEEVNSPMLITANEDDIYLNISDAITKINTTLLKSTNELDK